MIRLLDDLVLLKEIDEIEGLGYTAKYIQKNHPEKIVIIRHTAYVYRDILCELAQAKTTKLDDYIPLGELVDVLCVQKHIIFDRINFMKKNDSFFFDFINNKNLYFIKIDAEFKYLFQNFQPFLASFSDAENLVHCKLLGDIKIGFY
jgi:hypothetical protein